MTTFFSSLNELHGLPSANTCNCEALYASIAQRVGSRLRESLPCIDDALTAASSATSVTWEGTAGAAYKQRLHQLISQLQQDLPQLHGIQMIAGVAL